MSAHDTHDPSAAEPRPTACPPPSGHRPTGWCSPPTSCRHLRRRRGDRCDRRRPTARSPSTPPSWTSPPPSSSTGPRRRLRPGPRGRGPRRGGGAGRSRSPRPSRRGGHPPPVVQRHPERQVPRLLPVHLHRRGRRRARHRHHPDGVDRRPPRLPLLGRARPQGDLRGHPGGRRCPGRLLQRPGGRGDPGGRRSPAGPVRPHHAHVHLPGRLHRRPAGGHRPARRRRRAAAHRARPGQGHLAPFALEVGSRPRFFGSTSGSPIRPTSSTWWPSPTSPSGPWRTSGASPSASRPPRRPGPGRPRRARTGRRRGLPRNRPHVVRRPGHHEVVERHLAQRGLRHLHGGPAVDAFRPEWQRWVSFGVEREAAMAVDGLHATRPVEFPVGRPEEAQGMFDVLTYQKGGWVLRMLEQFLGPDVFREGSRLPPPTPRQHRDLGPVGRPRAFERPGGPDDHGHLDQPGRLPPGPGGRGRRLTQTPFSYRGDPGAPSAPTGRSRCSSAPSTDPGATPHRCW